MIAKIESIHDLLFYASLCVVIVNAIFNFMPWAPIALLMCYFREVWLIDHDMQKNVEVGELVLKYSLFAAMLYLLSLL